MKKTLQLSVVWALLNVAFALCAEAQTYPEYALGQVTPQTVPSLVRQYSSTQIVSVYRNTSGSITETVNVVDLSTNMYSINLNAGYEVYDMEIVNDYLFMCGRKNNSNAFIGCVYIPDIISGTASVLYHDFVDVTFFRKMVAFTNSSNEFKVVAWGQAYYSDAVPSVFSLCTSISPCSGPYLCSVPLVVELTHPETLSPNVANKLVYYDNHAEVIDDIVLTDNYVVFIGEGYNPVMGDGLTIHPCDKNSILADFDNYYYYPAPDEGYTYYIGCHMKGDTIAVASRGRYLTTGWSEFDTRVRVIDAASHVMTRSQAFDLNDYKTDPVDMVYIPETYRLVLLEDMIFPVGGSVNNSTFLFLEPYSTYPGGAMYPATGICEWINGLAFGSMDRVAGSKWFVATGGDYWMLKSVPGVNHSQTCYKIDKVNVFKTDNILGYPCYYPYCDRSILRITPSMSYPTTITSTISCPCYLP